MLSAELEQRVAPTGGQLLQLQIYIFDESVLLVDQCVKILDRRIADPFDRQESNLETQDARRKKLATLCDRYGAMVRPRQDGQDVAVLIRQKEELRRRFGEILPTLRAILDRAAALQAQSERGGPKPTGPKPAAPELAASVQKQPTLKPHLVDENDMEDEDTYHLSRFVESQDDDDTFEEAMKEIDAGEKRTHWMWFVFPQPPFGDSEMSKLFAISGADEADAFLAHPLLCKRIVRAAMAVANSPAETAAALMGGIDRAKLHSSMTLFARAAGRSGAELPQAACKSVLRRYFGGREDRKTARFFEESAKSASPVRPLLPY